MDEQKSKCYKLHEHFNALPRFEFSDDKKWLRDGKALSKEDEKQLPQDGIYIFFEKGEKFRDFDRIVRVGTHKKDGILWKRLRQHYTSNKDGSIFRKNIGRALLNENEKDFLPSWNNKGKGSNKDKVDSIEAKVSELLRGNFSFTVIPVETKEARLRYEEGIIATLARDGEFRKSVSASWLGKHSPEAEIRESGLWLKDGLNAEELTDEELAAVLRLK